MSYTVQWADSFISDFAKAPKNIQKSFQKSVTPHLRDIGPYPTDDGRTIKKLKGTKLFRYRISNFRLIYFANEKEKIIQLLILDKKPQCYKRAQYSIEDNSNC